MTPDKFKDWLKFMGWNHTQASKKLGIGKNTITSYVQGGTTISRPVHLACRYLAEEKARGLIDDLMEGKDK